MPAIAILPSWKSHDVYKRKAIHLLTQSPIDSAVSDTFSNLNLVVKAFLWGNNVAAFEVDANDIDMNWLL